MAQKAKLFHDAERYTAILRATAPKECKQLGRLVTPYDDSAWSKARPEILKRGLLEKFMQNPSLRAKLLSTGEALLAEASPFDDIFGIGLDAEKASQTSPAQWMGKNLLGQALMEVRQQLRNLQEQ